MFELIGLISLMFIAVFFLALAVDWYEETFGRTSSGKRDTF
jgi:hypothetical protein